MDGSKINKLVEQIIEDGLEKCNVPDKLLKKRKKRLRKSIKKQLQLHYKSKSCSSSELIHAQMVAQLKKKFSTRPVEVMNICETNKEEHRKENPHPGKTNPEDLNLCAPDSNASKFGSDVPEIEDQKTIADITIRRRLGKDTITKKSVSKFKSNRKILPPKEWGRAVDNGLSKHTKDQYTLNLNYHKNVNEKLAAKNVILSQRSKELSRIKLAPYLGSRTIAMVDDSNFSTFLGYIDEVLLESPVTVCEELPNTSVNSFKYITETELYFVSKAELINGEYVAIKYVRKDVGLPKDVRTSMVTYQAKVLGIISSHPNVISSHGIVALKEENALVMNYEGGETLHAILKRSNILRPLMVKQVLLGLSEGVKHIHDSGILHNCIIPENICVSLESSLPVLLGFSNSCRVGLAKCLTISQQKKVEKCIYLPDDVKLGRKAPSKISDIYSFGIIVRRMEMRVRHNALMQSNLSKLASLCIFEGKDLCACLPNVVESHMSY